jgi:signal transduction histidine kinase
MLGHVVDSLVDNATKHAVTGHWLRVVVAYKHRMAHVQVTDRGSGILPQDLPRVFDRFFRGTEARSRGAGLGLAIARRIVADHHGTLTIHSSPGEGTSVDVLLPTAQTV